MALQIGENLDFSELEVERGQAFRPDRFNQQKIYDRELLLLP
jgi:hypothetical protein